MQISEITQAEAGMRAEQPSVGDYIEFTPVDGKPALTGEVVRVSRKFVTVINTQGWSTKSWRIGNHIAWTMLKSASDARLDKFMSK